MQSPYYPHTLTDEDISRLQKKEALEALGKKAWPAMRPVTGTCLVVKERFKDLTLGNAPLNEGVALSHWKSKDNFLNLKTIHFLIVIKLLKLCHF